MNQKRPKNVWVLYGGTSSEREVSVSTSANIIEALKKKNFDVSGYDVRPGELLSIDWSNKPDVVFIGLHGTFGEDGTIQGFLESIGVPYVGSGVFSSALCFHKGLTKKTLVNFGLPTPASYEIMGQAGAEALADSLFSEPNRKHKYFIKAARQGSTVGVYPFDADQMNHDQAKNTFKELCIKALSFDECVLVEEWIVGREITVPVVCGKTYPAVEIRPISGFYDYESKYTKGKTEYICPAPASKSESAAMAALSMRAFEVLECRDYARVDFILSDNGPTILEVNTLPGMTSTSLLPKSAAMHGIDYPELMELLVCTAFNR
jgi:D-alanine-D-alanine ligase